MCQTRSLSVTGVLKRCVDPCRDMCLACEMDLVLQGSTGEKDLFTFPRKIWNSKMCEVNLFKIWHLKWPSLTTWSVMNKISQIPLFLPKATVIYK